jgi:hypothetical protein
MQGMFCAAVIDSSAAQFATNRPGVAKWCDPKPTTRGLLWRADATQVAATVTQHGSGATAKRLLGK